MNNFPNLAKFLADREKLLHLAGLNPQQVDEAADPRFELPHPSLSRPEVLRLDAKLHTAMKHLDALVNIFQELHEDDLDPDEDAVKLHHLVHKGELDMSLFNSMRQQIDRLYSEFEDLQMQWMSAIQQHTDPDMQEDRTPAPRE